MAVRRSLAASAPQTSGGAVADQAKHPKGRGGVRETAADGERQRLRLRRAEGWRERAIRISLAWRQSPPSQAHAAAGPALLERRDRSLAGDLRRRLPGGVRLWPARHVQALPGAAPALDLLPRPLRRPGGRARQPVRPAGQDRRTAALCAGRVRGHRGPSLLPPLRLRPDRHGAHGVRRSAPAQLRPGRLDHHPAAGAQPVPQPGPEHPAQGAGADPGGVAGDQVLQEGDPRPLPQPRLFRRRRLWHRGGGPPLLQQARLPAHRRRGRPAGRDDEEPDALQSAQRHRPRRAPGHGGARRDGQDPRHHPGPARQRLRPAGAGVAHPGQPARPVLRRLGRLRGAFDPRPQQGRRAAAGPGGRDHHRPADPDRRRARRPDRRGPARR